MITVGVDIGSVGTKCLVLDENKILSTAVLPTGARPKITAQMVVAQALAEAKLRPTDVSHTVSTGYGRRVVEFGENPSPKSPPPRRGSPISAAPGARSGPSSTWAGRTSKSSPWTTTARPRIFP